LISESLRACTQQGACLTRMPSRSRGATILRVRVLVVINDQPYGSERPYNALRLASALSKREQVEVRVFLMGDAVACAVAGQQLPDGHYHLDRMLRGLLHRASVGCCGTCLDARGLREEQLVEGARRSTLEELADASLWADKTLTF
jgi:uncharacterized protein involved in oxidation of intracellular sulfur